VQGFLNLNKPPNFTSHDCVAVVRRLLRLKRVGHGGTLDPAATGVLPIALGRATRLLQFLAHDKSYIATIRFGVRTSTDDLEGEVLHAEPVPWLDLSTVQAGLPQFQGQIEQIPPRYSAVQVQGKRLYDLARAGTVVEVPMRSVKVYDIKILNWQAGDFPELKLAIDCGSGTYIRSIARDLGELLRTGGCLASLTRTHSSGFQLADSLTLEALTAQTEQQQFVAIAPEVGLQHLPITILPTDIAKRWCQGQRVVLPHPLKTALETATICRVHREDDRLLGVGEQKRVEDGLLLLPQVVIEPEL
jgi:tRNA pseudouridine55 synthase